jgi:hypothetical protein
MSATAAGSPAGSSTAAAAYSFGARLSTAATEPRSPDWRGTGGSSAGTLSPQRVAPPPAAPSLRGLVQRAAIKAALASALKLWTSYKAPHGDAAVYASGHSLYGVLVTAGLNGNAYVSLLLGHDASAAMDATVRDAALTASILKLTEARLPVQVALMVAGSNNAAAIAALMSGGATAAGAQEGVVAAIANMVAGVADDYTTGTLDGEPIISFTLAALSDRRLAQALTILICALLAVSIDALPSLLGMQAWMAAAGRLAEAVDGTLPAGVSREMVVAGFRGSAATSPAAHVAPTRDAGLAPPLTPLEPPCAYCTEELLLPPSRAGHATAECMKRAAAELVAAEQAAEHSPSGRGGAADTSRGGRGGASA